MYYSHMFTQDNITELHLFVINANLIFYKPIIIVCTAETFMVLMIQLT